MRPIRVSCIFPLNYYFLARANLISDTPLLSRVMLLNFFSSTFELSSHANFLYKTAGTSHLETIINIVRAFYDKTLDWPVLYSSK